MVKKVKDFEYVRADLAAAVEYVTEAIERVKNAKDGASLVAVREDVNKYSERVWTMAALAEIRYTLDVNDKFYVAEKEYYDENAPALSAVITEFNKAFLASKHIGEAEKLLNPNIVKKMRASLRVMDERIVQDRVEENKLITEYDTLMATLKFNFNGKDYTISEMFKYTKDPDRAVRKAAFSVIGQTLEKSADKLDDIYDRMVKVRTRMAKKMGFENFVEMGDIRIEHLDYGRKEIKVFRDSVIADVVPVLSELKARLAEKLGLDKIHLYDNDNYNAGGNIDPEGDSDKLFEVAQSIYDDMNPVLGDFFRRMCEAEAFDCKAREGKLSGGYAEMLFGFGQPFIFANFNGTMDDVGVLTHEFGHAYAFERAYANGIDSDIFVGGMETAETHSMSMEALCNKYNHLFYGKRSREATYQQIFDAFNFLPYGVTVDYFQQLVYENPDMTPAERKALWLKLEGELRPYVDMSDIPYINIGGRWQYQKHIYEVPFYYIDYCLSTTLALQFGVLADKDYSAALDKYLKLVEAGGTKNITALAHEAGLKSPFDGGLKELCAAVKAQIESLE